MKRQAAFCAELIAHRTLCRSRCEVRRNVASRRTRDSLAPAYFQMLTRRTFLATTAAAALCPPLLARSTAIKIGVCNRDVAAAAKAGFAYIEPAAAEIAAMSEEDFRRYADQVL